MTEKTECGAMNNYCTANPSGARDEVASQHKKRSIIFR
ncbi:Uncharacterized protein dnm_002910 [Desulfonema magnum]|uniref:Uncharacterized protein n=1 Tax=Desulfonema magnum TaxID=45655 RepID=A0A975GK64_9BACT|nr:Uncharacterized protein dnm_002910 [Desulfonema magnum]